MRHTILNPINAYYSFRKAVDYLKQCFEVKERCVKLLTTKGNFLSTISIRSEMTGIQVRMHVTGFAKRGLVHASDFSTSRMCNSACV